MKKKIKKEPPIEQMVDDPTIKFLRLVTGEDIISLVNPEIINGKYAITYPMKIMYGLSSTKPSTYVLSFAEWVPSRIYDKQQFEIDLKDVLLISDVTEEMKEDFHKCLDYINTKQLINEKPSTKPGKKGEKELIDMKDTEDGISALLDMLKTNDLKKNNRLN